MSTTTPRPRSALQLHGFVFSQVNMFYVCIFNGAPLRGPVYCGGGGGGASTWLRFTFASTCTWFSTVRWVFVGANSWELEGDTCAVPLTSTRHRPHAFAFPMPAQIMEVTVHVRSIYLHKLELVALLLFRPVYACTNLAVHIDKRG